ncbi:GNAT family N-acetyltransferase [Halalkalibacter sp. APA_J-10(15)]|uniref:GNAT family N-acetyltransferase n=1 Tax=Halalkalibacter sp. APA_J-10(15) TaxID=2933805 RepID=UPI001FF52767|nr:GNAT family N-acetyltransferase [Halalkalibacter sp. APA_J-10(15)]MCK0473176.1 GNAT family N-acetyltransferase [Halalkalibacter sp. APA_J-10(15)]
MEIREAVENDIEALTSLMEQLGYPTTIEAMRTRFHTIESSPDYHTLVASYDGKIVGMVGVAKGYYYELNGVYVRIVALVVDAIFRNKGIGKKLVVEAESWERIIGATRIGLNSGSRPEREHAHKFYKNIGYVEKSIGFVKSLI